jgi:tRNA pseudouridine55 synthase
MDRYSALRMDGRHLYDYARTNTPLPRPIEARKCIITELVLEDWTEGGKHDYKYPEQELGEEEKAYVDRLENIVKESLESVGSKAAITAETTKEGPSVNKEGGHGQIKERVPILTFFLALPPTFTIRMTVSSGTYVRSIIHDIGIALGSAAHVVRLQRTRQGEFALDVEDKGATTTPSIPTIEWDVFERALGDRKEKRTTREDGAEQKPGSEEKATEEEEDAGTEDSHHWQEWEEQLLANIKTT